MRGGWWQWGMTQRMIFGILWPLCVVGTSQAAEAQRPSSLSILPGVLSGPAWAMSSNPAALAQTKAWHAGCDYRNLHGVNELNKAGFFLQWGRKSHGAGIAYDCYGPVFYRLHSLGLAYGQSLGPNVSGGVKLKYQQLTVPDAGMSEGNLSCDLGVSVLLGRQFSFAALLADPLYYSFRNSRGRPPAYSLGLQYHPEPAWVLAIEMHKLPECRPALVVGAGIKPNQATVAWVRYFSNPWQLEIGCGFVRAGLEFYAYGSYHAVLGLSPGIRLNYSLPWSN